MTQAVTAGRAPSECPRTPATRGSAFDYFWRSRDALLESRVERVRTTFAAEARAAQSIKVFALGHTHLAAAPVPLTRGGVTPVVLNAGAWQRTVTPFQIEEAMQARGWSEGDALRQLRPEDLPACYGVIWIEPYAGDPKPRVRFWRSDARWGTLPRDAAGMATACGAAQGLPPEPRSARRRDHFVSFVADQKSNCALSFANRAGSTSVGVRYRAPYVWL